MKKCKVELKGGGKTSLKIQGGMFKVDVKM